MMQQQQQHHQQTLRFGGSSPPPRHGDEGRRARMERTWSSESLDQEEEDDNNTHEPLSDIDEAGPSLSSSRYASLETHQPSNLAGGRSFSSGGNFQSSPVGGGFGPGIGPRRLQLPLPHSATFGGGRGGGNDSSATWTSSSGDLGGLSDTDEVGDRSEFVGEYNRLAAKYGVRGIVVVEGGGGGQESVGLFLGDCCCCGVRRGADKGNSRIGRLCSSRRIIDIVQRGVGFRGRFWGGRSRVGVGLRV